MLSDDDDVRVVSRLEGLKINEATATKELIAAADVLLDAKRKYETALSAFYKTKKARENEEQGRR